MRRNLRALHDTEMASTSPEARAAALQYVRRVSGSACPDPTRREVFEQTVLEVALATQRLMDHLSAPLVEVDETVHGGGHVRSLGEAVAG